MPADIQSITSKLWSAADEFRANSKLKASEYSVPVLGLIFLAYAENKFIAAEKLLKGKSTSRRAPKLSSRFVLLPQPEVQTQFERTLPTNRAD